MPVTGRVTFHDLQLRMNGQFPREQAQHVIRVIVKPNKKQ